MIGVPTYKVGESIYKDPIAYLEPSFFTLFDYKWMLGDPTTALLDPYSIVLTESLAKRYFGDSEVEKAIGEVIQLNNQADFKINPLAAKRHQIICKYHKTDKSD